MEKEIGTKDRFGRQNKWEFYNEHGKLVKVVHYKNDLEHGKFVRYYESGNVEMEGEFYEGKHSGVWIDYYANMQLKEEGKYINGEYNLISFYNKGGLQLFCNGKGIKLERYGAGEIDIYIQFFENNKKTEEYKISINDYHKLNNQSNKNVFDELVADIIDSGSVPLSGNVPSVT